MKKLLVIAVLGLMSIGSYAQDQQEAYCQIVGRATFSLKGKIKIEVDFGQEGKFFSNNVLKDPVTNKPIKFNSMVDALNFMAGDGWQLVNGYPVVTTSSTGSTETAYYYIMKKMVTKE